MEPWIARAFCLVAITALAACSSSDDDDDSPPAIPVNKAGTIVVLTDDNRIATLDPGTPGSLQTTRTIGGLQSLEEIVAIDYRPSTGELYGFSDQGRLYRIDTGSGDSALIGTGPISPALTGTAIGFDFNPVVDRIRVTTEADENVRLHPETGAVLGPDTDLAYAPGDAGSGSDPQVTALAYTQSFAGSTTTTLWGIDAERDVFVRIGSVGGTPDSPNGGQLTTIGSIGLLDAVPDTTGLDAAPSGALYAAITAPSGPGSRLYVIDPISGGADLLGTIGGSLVVRDLSVRPPAQPRIFGLRPTNQLVKFRPGRPETLIDSDTISGLQSGEQVVAIDVHPWTGDLYGVGSSSRLYKLNKESGGASAIGAGPFSPALLGTAFAMDIDPVSGLVRVLSDSEQHLLLSTTTGEVVDQGVAPSFGAGDPNFGSDPSVDGIAYIGGFAGSASTTLFGIDTGQDALVRLGSVGGSPGSPDDGELTTLGDLGIDVGPGVGFDVTPQGGAFAALSSATGQGSQLYSINLTSGQTSLIGSVGGTGTLIGIAVDIPVAPIVIGLTTDNRIVSFLPGAPGTLISNRPIANLQSAETVLAIDFRPSTGDLYALGSSSRLYAINRNTGAATVVGAGAFTPALEGTEFGMDISPIFDPIRVIGSAGQNLRLNALTGTAVADQPLSFEPGDVNFGVPPHVTAIAFSDNYTGTPATTLYGIDTNLDALVTVGSSGGSVSPNTGLLCTIAPLGLNASDIAGFDISVEGGALLLINAQGSTGSQLRSLDLASGDTVTLGTVGGTAALRGIALVPSGL